MGLGEKAVKTYGWAKIVAVRKIKEMRYTVTGPCNDLVRPLWHFFVVVNHLGKEDFQLHFSCSQRLRCVMYLCRMNTNERLQLSRHSELKKKKVYSPAESAK